MPILDPMHLNRATSAQIKYLEILFNDCNFTTSLERKSFLALRLTRTIRYLDELTKSEASEFIEYLKTLKGTIQANADNSSNTSRSVNGEEDGIGEISREDV